MEISEAIVRSIRSYYNNKGFAKYQEVAGKPMKYTKDYFDSVEEEMFPKKMVKDEMEGIEESADEDMDDEMEEEMK